MRIEGGWVIREIPDYGDWFEYWANKDNKDKLTADERGDMVLVSTEDMTRFCNSSVYQSWSKERGLGVPVLFGGRVGSTQDADERGDAAPPKAEITPLQKKAHQRKHRPPKSTRKRRSGAYYDPMRKALNALATRLTLEVVDGWGWPELRRHVQEEMTTASRRDHRTAGKQNHAAVLKLPADTRFKEVYNEWYDKTAEMREKRKHSRF